MLCCNRHIFKRAYFHLYEFDLPTWCPESLDTEISKENKSIDNYESMDKKIIKKVPKSGQLQLTDPPLL
jgi:hypothetical protein